MWMLVSRRRRNVSPSARLQEFVGEDGKYEVIKEYIFEIFKRSLFFLALKDIHIVFGLEIAALLACSRTSVAVLPLLLLLLIYLLDLSILMGKLKSLYLIFLVLLHILRVVRHYLQLVWDLELVRRLHLNLLHLLAGVPHRSQPVQFDYLLGVVLLVFD